MIDLITNDSELSEEVKSLTTNNEYFWYNEFIDIDFDLKIKTILYIKVITVFFSIDFFYYILD